MNRKRKSKIITAAVFDAAGTVKAPSVTFNDDEELELYRCCLVAIKGFLRVKREQERQRRN